MRVREELKGEAVRYPYGTRFTRGYDMPMNGMFLLNRDTFEECLQRYRCGSEQAKLKRLAKALNQREKADG